jgi:hypothetical protein
VPGDGIFDQELVPANSSGMAALEMAVSRIDFANLPAFANGVPPRNEVDLLVNYVEKTRRFRRRQVTYPEGVVQGAFFSASAAQEQVDGLGQHMSKLADRISAAITGTNAAAIKADFVSAQIPGVWGILGGYGGGPHFINAVAAVNTYHGVSPHLTADLVPLPAGPPVAFILMEASFSSQWSDPDHLGRAFLATPTNCFAWSYFGAIPRIEWQYATMALGRSLGAAWLKTQNDAWMWPLISIAQGAPSGTGVKVFSGSRSQGGHTYTRLLGDPTLRQAPASPPGPLTAITNASGGIVLSWGPSADPSAKYQVYRTVNGAGSKWSQLHNAPQSATTFTDSNPPAGNRHYQVRSLVLKAVASGSYTNISAGSVWP